MKATLINKEEAQNLHKRWGEFARICYNTPQGKELAIGKGCHLTGHYSGSRTTYFIFHIEGVSRALTAQLNRHSIGVVINEKSMRYVDFSDADITIPPSINNNKDAKEVYEKAVNVTKQAYKLIQNILKEQEGLTGESNNQDARYICPIGTQTEGMWAFTIEALEHFMNKRLCERSQWEIRDLAKLMRNAVIEANPDLANRLVPHCIELGWCPEGRMQCLKFKNTILTKKEFKDLQKTEEFKNIVKNIKLGK